MSELKEVWNFKSHEGYQKAYQHHSQFLKDTHEFSIYLPPKAVKGQRCPVIYWLTGAASDDREFMLKSGFQKYASENEIIVVAPEPRPGQLNDMPKEISSKYFVQFGFYLDATEPPYDEKFKMYSYVMNELIPMVEFKFPVLQDKRGIAGHSMGGMGALNLGLRHHDLFQSMSVFSAVSNPSGCTIGRELMKYYFGDNAEEATKLYDPCILAANYTGPHRHIIMSELKEVWDLKSHNGYQKAYQHHSQFLKNTHEFSIYLPPKAVKGQRCPVIYWFAGASAEDREFATKSDFQKYASENEIIMVAPEPKPVPLSDVEKRVSAKYLAQFGFYLDATEPPYDEHFKMYSYLMNELMPTVESRFPVLQDKRGIAGHSMGGMAALNYGLRHHDLFQSISLFSAICNPGQNTLLQECMKYYFGNGMNEALKLYDPCIVTSNYTGPHRHILFDHGSKDELDSFLGIPEFLKAATNKDLSVTYRIKSGYTHGMGIIASFIGDHIVHHRKELNWNP